MQMYLQDLTLLHVLPHAHVNLFTFLAEMGADSTFPCLIVIREII